MGGFLLALIIPFIVKCFDVYLFRQFFLDVPDDLIEAAEIDGAGPFKTFLQVIIPVSKPVFATVFILDYVAYWSDFMWPLLLSLMQEKGRYSLVFRHFYRTSGLLWSYHGCADYCICAYDHYVPVFTEILCAGNFYQWY